MTNWEEILKGLPLTTFSIHPHKSRYSCKILTVETPFKSVSEVIATLPQEFELIGSHSIYEPGQAVSYYEDQKERYTHETWKVQLVFEGDYRRR